MADGKDDPEERGGCVGASASRPPSTTAAADPTKDVQVYAGSFRLRSHGDLSGGASFLSDGGDDVLYSSLTSILPILPKTIGCLNSWKTVLALMWPTAPQTAVSRTGTGTGTKAASFSFRRLGGRNGGSDPPPCQHASLRFTRSSLERSVITRPPGRRRFDRRWWQRSSNRVGDGDGPPSLPSAAEEEDVDVYVCRDPPRVDPSWPSSCRSDVDDTDGDDNNDDDDGDVVVPGETTSPSSKPGPNCRVQNGGERVSVAVSVGGCRDSKLPECGPRTFLCKAGAATELCCYKAVSRVCDAACRVRWVGSYWCWRRMGCGARADKTEGLTEDLLDLDRRLETLQRVCQVAFKKVKECLVGVGAGVDDVGREKRLKKLPMHQMASAVLNLSESLDKHEPLAMVLRAYGQKGQEMAMEYLDYEVQLEKIFLGPLTKFLDHDFPALAKQKSKLQKLALDLDGARSRYAHAVKSVTEQAKIDQLREEVEDYQSKVESCRDNLAADMYQMLARQSEVAQLIIQMSREQKKYHESSLSLLTELLPDLESNIKENPSQRVWGTPLEEHLRVTNREIALPLEFCVRALLKNGTKEEGLFRIAGSNSKVRRLRNCLDAGVTDVTDVNDAHVVASALKSYLRDLPEPLMTYGMYKEWLKVAEIKDGDERTELLRNLVERLPESHRANLRYLIKFLARLCQSQDVNKMSSQNVAIVMAPNLMWSPADVGNLSMNMNDNGLVCSVIDSMVTHCDRILLGDENFKRTPFLESEDASSESDDPPAPQQQQHSSNSGHRRHASNEGAVDDHRSDASQTSSANHSPTLVPASPRQGLRRKNRTAPVPPRPQKPPPPKPAAPCPSATTTAVSSSLQQLAAVGAPCTSRSPRAEQRLVRKSPETAVEEEEDEETEKEKEKASPVSETAGNLAPSKEEAHASSAPAGASGDLSKPRRDDIGFEALVRGSAAAGDHDELSPTGTKSIAGGGGGGGRPRPELPERTIPTLGNAGAERPPLGFNVGVTEPTAPPAPPPLPPQVADKPVPAERRHVRQGSGPDLPMLRPKPAVPGRPTVLKRNSMLEKGTRMPPPPRTVTSYNPSDDGSIPEFGGRSDTVSSPSPPPALPLKQRNAVYIKHDVPLNSSESPPVPSPPEIERRKGSDSFRDFPRRLSAQTRKLKRMRTWPGKPSFFAHWEEMFKLSAKMSPGAEGESPSVKQKPPRPAPPTALLNRDHSASSSSDLDDPAGAAPKARANSDGHDTKM